MINIFTIWRMYETDAFNHLSNVFLLKVRIF